MITLNQLVSSTASLLKEPFNHELKERLVDSYKQLIANRIRHSIERHGLDEQLKLSYPENIQVLNKDEEEVYDSIAGDFFDDPSLWTLDQINTFIFRTRNKIFEPIRFKNDAPFTFVGTKDRSLSFPYRSQSGFKYVQSFLFTGGSISYHLKNGRIVLNCHDRIELTKIRQIEIESIFYEPEKVVTLFDNEDGLDAAIPLPHDAISSITHELLQKEFGIISPSNIEVKINEKERKL